MTNRKHLIAWHARWAEVNIAADRAAANTSPAQRLRLIYLVGHSVRYSARATETQNS